MKNLAWSCLIMSLFTLLSVTPARAQAEDCVSVGAHCDPAAVTTVTYEAVPFDDANLENGKVRGVDCDLAFQFVADRIVTVTVGESSTRYYAGSFCFDNGAAPGDTTITTDDVMELVTLPTVQVHHNPHHDLLVNVDTWFWHTGPTTHTQTVTLPVDANTTITGTYTGQITTWCWTVDDPRDPLPPVEVGGAVCETPDGATTYASDHPGHDDPTDAAAHHTFRHHQTTTLTHEVLWTGTLTVTGGPSALRGQTLTLSPTAVRAHETAQVRQIYPQILPNP